MSLFPQSAKIALENASPRPELPRGPHVERADEEPVDGRPVLALERDLLDRRQPQAGEKILVLPRQRAQVGALQGEDLVRLLRRAAQDGDAAARAQVVRSDHAVAGQEPLGLPAGRRHAGQVDVAVVLEQEVD